MTTTTTIDSHSLTPNSLNLVEGQSVSINGKTFKVTRATKFQAFFAKQGFVVPGASKANPVSLEVEILGAVANPATTPEIKDIRENLKARLLADEPQAEAVNS